jgi:hypothetical protein
MNKLKTYESFFEMKYQDDDYIKFKKGEFNYPYAKIIQTMPVASSYKVEMFFSYKFTTKWIDESQIERLMTPDEIEEFNLELMTNKYNI